MTGYIEWKQVASLGQHGSTAAAWTLDTRRTQTVVVYLPNINQCISAFPGFNLHILLRPSVRREPGMVKYSGAVECGDGCVVNMGVCYGG